jgi:hypothetical protein
MKIKAIKSTDNHIVYPINFKIFTNKLVHSLFVDATIKNEITTGEIKITINIIIFISTCIFIFGKD